MQDMVKNPTAKETAIVTAAALLAVGLCPKGIGHVRKDVVGVALRAFCVFCAKNLREKMIKFHNHTLQVRREN